MKNIEKVLKLDIIFVQRIKSRSKSKKSKKSNRRKTTHAVLIDAIAKSLLANEIDISEIKHLSRYFFENKRRFNLMYKACSRNVQRLSMNNVSISYDAIILKFRKKRQ